MNFKAFLMLFSMMYNFNQEFTISRINQAFACNKSNHTKVPKDPQT